MKYLDSAPFSGRANTPEFNKGYDNIVWDKDKASKDLCACSCPYPKHENDCLACDGKLCARCCRARLVMQKEPS